jgi:hypothetical protein
MFFPVQICKVTFDLPFYLVYAMGEKTHSDKNYVFLYITHVNSFMCREPEEAVVLLIRFYILKISQH